MRKYIGISLLLACFLGTSGCTTDYYYGDDQYYKGDTWVEEQSVLNGAPLMENKGIYSIYEDELKHIYLKIQEGYVKETEERFTYSYLKNYTWSDWQDGTEPFVNVIMTDGTDKESFTLEGFGFGEMTPNARMTVKGSRNRIQSRSYQVKLYERAGLYEGQRTLNFIKNNGDLSRIKIKLGLDLASRFPDAASLRTEFVRLFVYDTTEGGILKWVDQGVYTLVEQPNKAYLSSHGLDENGTLYRAEDFAFENEDSLLPMDHPSYNNTAFEELLAIREAENHDKILEVLDVLERQEVSMEEILSLYFEEENLLTYAAWSVMMHNVEAGTKDYLIYSPKNSKTFYFIFENFRNAFEEEMKGYGFLLNNKVFRLYLEEEDNRIKLMNKVKELRGILTDDLLNDTVYKYKQEILSSLYSMPEINLLPGAAKDVEPYMEEMIKKIKEAESFNYRVKVPYIESYTRDGSIVKLDFDREAGYSYEAIISADRRFEEIVATIPLSGDTFSYTVSGTFYVRLTAVAPDGTRVFCGNISKDILGRDVYGGLEIE